MSVPEVVESVEQAGLVYVTDAMPGISRRREGDGFAYVWPDGRRVKEEQTLQRIRSLAIPPAYESVWICPQENGHLQATGKDTKGRKQYRYHPRFRETRDASKYDRMSEFASALPKIHARLEHDLSLRGLPRDKVLAVLIHLLERSLIRVGNEEYAKSNHSYGLTTMLNRHVKVEGSEVRFSFLGKSKIRHRIALHDRRLARVVRRLQDLPGQELFQYLDENGDRHSVTSTDVNAYLKEISGGDFTAKDFRTWAGTVLALTELAGAEPPATKREAKATVTRVLKTVAAQLGNTPAVCRKCYVHPAVLEAYAEGTLLEVLSQDDRCESPSRAIQCVEDAVKRLLGSHHRQLDRAA
ncbi:DNA topoisomerase IB [Fimbriimonas ginsengisoli]|uniref:DNA topoisomerase n=1 Tax=Fimbriimonas ginsengisoli Gsoil 348 TaxID=661478 RepID=A0A068NQP2_FIMGI|nr:DNA topoisomerase IB [Fimbriimonas ginsengisoli]AIE85756.1 type IB DNA topoisomerase [Fimbriimonas ginsengisoli Gsoil 348]